MRENTRKMAVLAFLKAQAPARDFACKELLQELGPGYTERSLRRWLGELVAENQLKKTGQKKATRYSYKSPNAIVKANLRQNFFNQHPMKSIQYITQPIFQRQPVAYNKDWLKNYIPNRTFYLSAQYRESLHTHGQRDADHNPAGTYARKIYDRLLIDLSYNSSRLEGNTYSLLETEKLVIEGRAPVGKLNAEKVMIINHKEAIRHLVEAATKIEINFNEICTLHFLLSDGLVPVSASGKVRDHAVRISASTYIPLENPSELERQLNIICEKAQKIKNPFECSFFLLSHIAYLQAFTDVNKRTSRLSANIPLILNNQAPLSFNDVEKEDYNSAMMAIYELNDIKPLVELYHFSYLRSCQQHNATAVAMGFDEVRVRYRQLRRDIVGHIIANQLIGRAMDDYLQAQVGMVPATQRLRFLATVTDDLRELSPGTIVGLGITLQQLKAWLALSK